MHKDVSPEEKLLSIIKGKQSAPDSASGAPKPEVKEAKKPIVHVPWDKVDGYISAILKNDFLKKSILDAKVLKIFNRYALIATALVAVFLFFDMILVSPSRKAALLISKASSSATVVTPAEKTMPIEAKGYSYYSNKVSGKNIFGAGSAIQSDSQTSGADLSADTSGGSLGLVGIIPGGTPQAIVEDKKSSSTYYLVKGQSTNGITVEDISDNKVVLDYKGKKLTLFL